MLSINDGLTCSDTLGGPRICGINHLFVRRSKKECTSMLLSKLSRLILKSLIGIISLFSFFLFYLVCFSNILGIVSILVLGVSILHLLQCFNQQNPLFQAKMLQTHFLGSYVFWINHHEENKGQFLQYKIHSHHFLWYHFYLYIFDIQVKFLVYVDFVSVPGFCQCYQVKIVVNVMKDLYNF